MNVDDKIKLERAYSLANETMFTISLQCRRVKSEEPEDTQFVMRWWADLLFLILALYRLRKIFNITKRIPHITNQINVAITDYDTKLPYLSKFRNVIEHLDEYAIDEGHTKGISRKEIQVGSWDGNVFEWLNEKLDVNEAEVAAGKLFLTFKKIMNSLGSKN